MKAIKLITQDRAGLIADISELLAEHQINIQELEGKAFDQQAVVELVVDRPNEAMQLLRAQGFKVVSNELITIRIIDQHGALAKVTRDLNEAKLSIRGISTLQRQDGYCFVALSTDNDKVARKLLHAVLI